MNKFSDDWYAFDMDDTLSDPTHRLHHLQTPTATGGKDWDAFHEDLINDPPIEGTLRIAEALQDAGANILILTSRLDTPKCRRDTLSWLATQGLRVDALIMRPSRSGKAQELKPKLLREWVDNYPERNLVAVFEDKPETVAALRAEGFHTLAAASGKYH